MEVVILAGGLGTRLKSVISDIPKPMAPVSGFPFLKYIFDYLAEFNVERVILSVGVLHKVIEDFFGKNYKQITIDYSVEDTPLGTGGAIKKALGLCTEENVIILNGDTFFNINLLDFYYRHQSSHADISLALKPMQDFDRYGKVITDDCKVVKFSEKEFCSAGDINGGIYVLKRNILEKLTDNKFSFEKDILEKKIGCLNIHGYRYSEYFIDIGVPQDYEIAQAELFQLVTRD